MAARHLLVSTKTGRGTFLNASLPISYTYDAVSRLATLTNDLSGTTNDLSVTFTYNPASQIISTVRTGDAYAYTAMGNGSTAFTQNGLNQQINIGGSTATWDARGNLTAEPQSAKTYGYSSENLLTSATGAVTLGYDPGMRLYQVAGAATTRFAYDGLNAIADYDGSNALQHRYVFAPGIDQPIVQYDASGNRSFLSSDERGSIVSLTDSSGALIGLNRYDEYGKPGASNLGRFQYTGQKWIGEANLYDYKARMYGPQLGRFVQTDPIGYVDSPNLYQYVLNDSVNLSDPFGLVVVLHGCGSSDCSTIFVNGPGKKPAVSYCDANPSDTICGNSGPAATPGAGNSRGPGGTGTGGKATKQTQCQKALQQPGKIEYGGNTGSLVLLGGLQASWGTWKNLATGSTGNYLTVGGGLGFGLGATGDYGHARSLADFVGYGETGTIGLSYEIVGGSYSATQDAMGDWVAQGGSLGLDVDLPGTSLGKVGGTATAIAGETTISSCNVRGR